MKRSTNKVLTTHVGSLPELASLDGTAADYPGKLRQQVAAVVQKQREIGLDVINEGEYTKEGDWLTYIDERLAGFTQGPPKGGKPVLLQGKDREEFADFYRYASERGTLFYAPGNQIRHSRPYWVCTEPVTYRGQTVLAREIEIFRAVAPADAFLTSTAPASFEPYRDNAFYKSEEEFVFALAEAMRTEYEAIAQAGFQLQVDDAWRRRCGTASASKWGSKPSASAACCGSRRSTTRSATFPRSRSAITSAGAAGMGRMPTTSR